MQDPASEVRLRLFQPDDADAFRRLNQQWIEKLFKLEAPDLAVLHHPDEHILAPGGAIIIAEAQGRVIGTCALLFEHAGVYEVAKMAVDELWRGSGIGRKILLFTIAEARRLGAHTLRLETSSKLPNAIHLYEAVGFRHVPAHHTPYARADVFMEMNL
jgi:N-acetylglutamate synthase-like GNAT family acetyltransferase